MTIISKCIWIIVLLQVDGFVTTGDCQDQAEKATYDNKLIEPFSFYQMPEKPENYLGCGCSFHLENSPDDLIFISKLGKKTKTLMKIDRAFVYLEPKEPTNFPLGSVQPKKRGGKLNYEFIGDGVEVKVELKATSVCPPADEKCEGVSYKAIVTAIKGNRKQIIQAKGNCGC